MQQRDPKKAIEDSYKKEIFDEIDEFEDIDLFGNKEDVLEDDEDSDSQEEIWIL